MAWRRTTWLVAASVLLAPASSRARRAWPADGSPVVACLAAARAAGMLEGVPDGLMPRIALAESGRPDVDGIWRPWPWSANADGAEHAFASAAQAVAWARLAPRQGIRFLDVGCLQVNLQYHPRAFASLPEAFDPWANARYAAHYLRALHDAEAGGDWAAAVGLYHSHDPVLGADYRARVAELGAGIIAGITPGALAVRVRQLGLLRLTLSNGRSLRVMLGRQPTQPGHRRPSACQVAEVLRPGLAVAPRLAACPPR